MKQKHIPRLILLFGFLLIAIFVMNKCLRSSEPTYHGKTFSGWFREYSNNEYYQFPVVQADPAWLAIKEMGTNAVPHLVKNLHLGRFHSTYVQMFVRLPGIVQVCLPNPGGKEMKRLHAISILGELRHQANSATPELLQLLKNTDPQLRSAVILALNGIHSDRKEMTKLLLQLGFEKRYADVVDIAEVTSWDGNEVTQLLTSILLLPDVALRRKAINLLEKLEAKAIPILPEVTQALKDSDHEVRYLAARTMQHLGPLPFGAIETLKNSLQDTNIMVQNAARRALQLNGIQ